MSYGLEWKYAAGYYTITPDGTLHIFPSMPEDIQERFLKQAEEARKKTREQNAAGCWTSADFDYDRIVYDDGNARKLKWYEYFGMEKKPDLQTEK